MDTDPTPRDPSTGLPVGPDGRVDLSHGIPMSDAERAGLHMAVQSMLSAMDKMDARAKRQHILEQIDQASNILTYAIPVAMGLGVVPAGVAGLAKVVLSAVKALTEGLMELDK